MADAVRELLIRIKGDGSGLVGEVLKGEQSLKGFGDQVDKQSASLRNLSNFANEARLAIIAYAGAQALNLHGILEHQDAVGKLSQVYGIAVGQLSSYSYIAKLAKISDEELALGLRNLIRNMDEAVAHRGDGGRILKALGLQAEGKGLDQMLGEIADKFASFRDGPEKAALAIQLFGRSGERLIPFLNQGASGIAALRAEAERLGITFGGETAKRAEEFNDNLTRVNATLTAGKMVLINDYLPALNQYLEQMLKGREIAGGFFKAAVLFGTMNPFASVAQNMVSIRREIEESQRQLSQARPGSAGANMLTARIDDARKQLEFLKFMQQQEVLKPGDQYLDARDLQARAAAAGGPKGAAPRVLDLTQEKQLLNQLQDQYAQLTGHVSVYDAVQRKMTEGTKEFDPVMRRQIEAWARRIDLQRKATIESVGYVEITREQEALDAADSARQDAAIAARIQLINERKQLEISSIVDPVVRARAAFEEESRLKYEQLVKDKGNIDEFERWRIAREKQLGEQIKPEYQKMLDSWSDTNRLMRDNWDRTMTSTLRAGEDMFVQFATTGKAQIADLARVIESEMARSLYRQTVGSAAGSGLFGWLFGPGGDSQAGLISHSGGEIGADSFPTRMLPARTWARAPRLHAGLAADEFPAILQSGETVLPRGTSAVPAIDARLNVSIHAPGAAPGTVEQLRAVVRDEIGPALVQHRRAIAGIVESEYRQSGRRR